MSIFKQQALFLFVALLSMVIYFFIQENISTFFKLPEHYILARFYKYSFAVLVNYALISLLYAFLRRTWIALLLSQLIFFGLTLINIQKEKYLSSSLVPSDFLLLPETFIAAPWSLKLSAVTGLILFIILTVWLYKKERRGHRSLWWVNGTLCISFFAFMVTANFSNNFKSHCAEHQNSLLCTYNQAFPNTRSDWVGDHLTIRSIGITTFFMSKSLDTIHHKVFKSENISEDRIANILDISALETPSKITPEVDVSTLPNLVFVMSEAHWNASQLDPSIPKHITPTIEKYQIGNMLSPSFGGGTANVEFEVLTGLNSFINHHETVYVSKLKRPTYSLASQLNDLGYNSTAMHNNGKYFYNRNTVYQNLGFQRFVSLENMVSDLKRQQYTNAAGWANDELIYQSIKTQLQQSSDQPQFIYAVTVENHFNYNDDRFGKDNFKIKKPGISHLSQRQLNTYLSGLKRADQHFKDLIEYSKNIERPTMIIYFGDHLPNLGVTFDEFGFFANDQEKTEKNHIKFYSTPIAIWNNFPIQRNAFDQFTTPAHFLGLKTLSAANIPLSPYYEYLKRLNACYHKIHKTGVEATSSCQGVVSKMLKSYQDLNMDILNGKNFSYEFLKSKPSA